MRRTQIKWTWQHIAQQCQRQDNTSYGSDLKSAQSLPSISHFVTGFQKCSEFWKHETWAMLKLTMAAMDIYRALWKTHMTYGMKISFQYTCKSRFIGEGAYRESDRCSFWVSIGHSHWQRCLSISDNHPPPPQVPSTILSSDTRRLNLGPSTCKTYTMVFL